ncbi:unnamed protein product [Notodromas monacha]|uniref:Copper type II ascorbate-dependent monooxygenase C-terminal domain-containing protein n=1 Tax=Notodromas monacha TaxID=399045 RepID=A0A7R9G8L9_9CRUS|nr:unnamed protein product [Notodromas monacha]CAG0913339.1 unnamed protein product [Notodromas monacha]
MSRRQCLESLIAAEGYDAMESVVCLFDSRLDLCLLPAGEKITLRQIRNGTELQPITQDRSYDFNYQEYRLLSEPRRVMPRPVRRSCPSTAVFDVAGNARGGF